MKVVVTGTEGYLGALVAPLLMQQGYEVLGIDTGFYRTGCLFNGRTDQPRTLSRDVRQVGPEDLKGYDAAVHLAELSNDPLGEIDPSVTHEINHRGTMRFANVAKQAGVKRFIYMSSCSVYGVAQEEVVSEESSLNPQTAYAVCKALCEKDLMELANRDFTVCCFRNATAFGASPRQRFDLVLNNLCGLAWTSGEISLTSDGSPWRPLIHGLDIGKAIACALDAPSDAIQKQILNIGSNTQNYRVKEIASQVQASFPNCNIRFGANGHDNRSYRVCFDKVKRHLPEFECAWDAEKGVRQMRRLFDRIALSKEDFERRPFTRLKQLQYLIETKQVDGSLYWNSSI